MFVLIALLVLGFLIIVHELGHFTVAKLSGVQVDEFSVGFGPQLIGYKPPRDTTKYVLRLLPLGGYVKMAGEMEDDGNVNGFVKKPVWVRMCIILAGSVTNFLIGMLLFMFVFSFIGIPAASNTNIIGQVVSGSPASRVGLQPGDRIAQVENVKTDNWVYVAQNIHSRGQQLTHLLVVRNNHRFEILVTPKYDTSLKFSQIGISPSVLWQKQGWGVALNLGLERTFSFAQTIFQSLFGLVNGSVSSKDLAGPVGITQMIGDAARGGIGYLLSFTAILGINLAIVNMLPIPALDGSRFLFLVVEGIRGKPVDPEKENIVHLIGFALLMLLFILITYNDLARIITGGWSG